VEDAEDGTVTARPQVSETLRPGDGPVSLEEYAALVGSIVPREEDVPLDVLIRAILDQHELEAMLPDSGAGPLYGPDGRNGR
jgi:hypothetical protein